MQRLIFPDQTQGLAIPRKPVSLTKSVTDVRSLVREMKTVLVVMPCNQTVIVTVVVVVVVIIISSISIITIIIIFISDGGGGDE